jgi:ankyrin repeat protein
VLLEAGAEVNHASNNGWTALTEAAWTGPVEAVRALLVAGAAVNHAAKNGRSALHLAAHHGHVEAVRALAEAGADLHRASKSTPLAIARANNQVAAALALVQAGATE